MSKKNISSLGKSIINAVSEILLGQHEAIEAACCCFFAGGHLLINDVPGTGKTTMARALAKVVGGEFRRIQFTSDLLPADITGVSIWDADLKAFRFQKGPLFSNIVLADEINRAAPKTQSALLEAMSEKSISVEGDPLQLPFPFMVIATENEKERYGTYPLPESQLDRFLMRISMGYPDPHAELEIMSRKSLQDPVQQVETVLSSGDAAAIFNAVDNIHVDKSVLDYMSAIVNMTRKNTALSLGVGPRGGMALHRSARALALIRGRDFCIADDVKSLAVSVLAHRVIISGDVFHLAGDQGTADGIIREILADLEIPI